MAGTQQQAAAAQGQAQKPSAADEAVRSAQAKLQERLMPKLEEAQARLTETNEKVKQFIREHPGTCLLGAAALGFLVGRWAARR